MIRLILIAAMIVWAAGGSGAGVGIQNPESKVQDAPAPRFCHVDLWIDSHGKPLAAWQVRFSAGGGGDVKVVGIEGGEHPAYRTAPYYDPAAMMRERVIMAAFSTAEDLPAGKTRVARIHLRVVGDARPEYSIKLMAAAEGQGATIAVDLSITEGESP